MQFIYMKTKKTNRNKTRHFSNQAQWILSDLRSDWKPTQNKKIYRTQSIDLDGLDDYDPKSLSHEDEPRHMLIYP